MEKCVGVEWELEQICEVSLLTNQVVKVVPHVIYGMGQEVLF